MSFAPTNSDVNVEAQQVPLEAFELRETRDTRSHPAETTSIASRALTASTGHEPDIEAQPVMSSPSPDGGEGEAHEMSSPSHQSERADATGQTPTRVEQGEIQVGAQVRPTPEAGPNSGINNSARIDGGHGSNRDPEEKRMIGDFDGSANALWALYRQEAKNHDESHIQTLKDDMDGVLIFAGLYSAVLTSFIIDSKQNLKPNPSDQMVYYLQQNVALLSQISRQLSFIAPQFAIPANPPPPFPTFNPAATDVRVNAFWFMALAFSLSAALLAILVQQWVRDYMHVFRRYGDPLKSARVRQYLYEGSEGWYMPIVAEAVPGLLHVSLFLFFAGLADFVLNVNTVVGLTTIVPIGISGMFYIFTTFAPVLYPQSPYQNSFSGVIWYIVQKSKLFGRRFKDRDGKPKLVSTNMARGQMQLAMEETEDRKGRDVEGIRWLVDNLTEDGEMESFAMAIPGSFNGKWSFEVWTKLSRVIDDKENTHRNELVMAPLTDVLVHVGPPAAAQSSIRTNTTAIVSGRHSPNTHPSVVPTSIYLIHELSKRIAHLFETCNNRGAFASDELWRKRTCACVVATASLVCYADAELGWFGDISRTLGDIGSFEKIRESSSEGKDQSFVIRWTCLSMIAIQRTLNANESLKEDARSTIASYADFQHGDGSEDEVAERNAREIDKTFNDAWFFVLRGVNEDTFLYQKIPEGLLQDHSEETTAKFWESVHEIGTSLRSVDSKILTLRERVQDSHGITRQIPGIQFDDLDSKHEPRRTLFALSDLPISPFIFPHQILDMFLWHHGNGNYLAELIRLKRIDFEWVQYSSLKNRSQRQLWRVQDLRDGGGLGFTVELFLLALKQLLSSSPSHHSQSALYIFAFRAITSDWGKYQRSLGTQKLLLDAAASPDGVIHRFHYPTYITDELLVLLDHILEGQTGPHIEDAMHQLSIPDDRPEIQEFRTKALRVISRSE